MTELQLYDNTRISGHRKCNRRYYWRHVRHIAPKGTKPALAFGSCWHTAMDAVWTMASDPQNSDALVADVGYAAFCEAWQGEEYQFPLWHEMSIDQRQEFDFRHDETARHMLTNYVAQRRSMMARMTLIECEKPFAVPLDPNNPDLFYVGRLDKVVEWEGRIWVIEHKTTSDYRKAGYFNPAFVDSFSPNSQIDGYLHAIHMLYGNKAKGIMIDAALVHKTVHEGFLFIPVERHLTQLDAWQWEALHEVEIIKNSMLHVNDYQDAPFLPAFPKNTTACVEFNSRCVYTELCKFIANPTTEPDREFPGFEVKKWEPFKELQLEKVFEK